jgi:hypothetical protein
MESVIKFLTYSHVIAGTISLVAAPIALVVFKGGKAHRLWGQIFFWAMTWIFISALIISLYKSIPFLLMLSILSYFLVVSAYRTLYLKKIPGSAKYYDWLSVIITGGFMLYFVGSGIYNIIVQKGTIAYLSIFFGIGGLYLVWRNVLDFIRPPKTKHDWLFRHIGNMTGGFIASVTAFSANVLYFMPGALSWLWPSLIGVPLIIYWIRTYRRKLGEGIPLSKLVELKR